MSEYSLATGACTSICDINFMSPREFSDEMPIEKNICSLCSERRKYTACREMHMNAIKESQPLGGSCTYTCPLGFFFWTSPVYQKGHIIYTLFGCASPDEDQQKIKAFAELLLICSLSLSIESEGCHDEIKCRSQRQSDISAKIEKLKSQYPQEGPQPEYPLDKEQKLLDALRLGNTILARQLLCEILAVLFYTNPGDFSFVQQRAIELAFLLSRLGLGSVFTLKTMLENNSRNLSLIQETTNTEELTGVLYRILDEQAEQMDGFRGIRHAAAFKKAERYILENFTRKISLEEIAGASGFSAPYFSTIFKEEMGENLSNYLNRLRVEKAAVLLTETKLSLSKIAHICGFDDQSWFSKVFKLFTGKSPGKFRGHGGNLVPKIPEIVFSDHYPEASGS